MTLNINTLNTERNITAELVRGTLLESERYYKALAGEKVRVTEDELTSIAVAWQEAKEQRIKDELASVFYTVTENYRNKVFKQVYDSKGLPAGSIDMVDIKLNCDYYSVFKGLSLFKKAEGNSIKHIMVLGIRKGIQLSLSKQFTAYKTGEKDEQGQDIVRFPVVLRKQSENKEVGHFVDEELITAKCDRVTLDELGTEAIQESDLQKDIYNTGTKVDKIMELVGRRFGTAGIHVMKAQTLPLSERKEYYIENLGFKKFDSSERKKVSRLWKSVQEFCLMNKSQIYSC